jgi:hypothetical protein
VPRRAENRRSTKRRDPQITSTLVRPEQSQRVAGFFLADGCDEVNSKRAPEMNPRCTTGPAGPIQEVR